MFDPPKIDKTKLTLHTGGALGSDSYFEKLSIEYGISVRAYSYKTKYHNSPILRSVPIVKNTSNILKTSPL